mmetsp:Transcript_7778/g.19183  ORF Transcript_7778/g.19183 Transcript_7778/m.19183 type:complete len:92 (+) Transcript_7778:364-639(+)
MKQVETCGARSSVHGREREIRPLLATSSMPGSFPFCKNFRMARETFGQLINLLKGTRQTLTLQMCIPSGNVVAGVLASSDGIPTVLQNDGK